MTQEDKRRVLADFAEEERRREEALAKQVTCSYIEVESFATRAT